MHESSVVENLLRQLQSIAAEHGAKNVSSVHVKLGVFSQISAEHFKEHFLRLAHGTVAENASLNIQSIQDETDPRAQEVVLETIEVEN